MLGHCCSGCVVLQAAHTLSHHPKLKNRDIRAQNNRYSEWAREQIRQKYMQFVSSQAIHVLSLSYCHGNLSCLRTRRN